LFFIANLLRLSDRRGAGPQWAATGARFD